jgi:hypothetical protein
MLAFAVLTVAVGQLLFIEPAFTLTHADVMVHEPTMLPPHAAVLLQLAEPLPHPAAPNSTATRPTADTTLVILMPS